MLTFNTAASFKTPYQVNCKKAITNPIMNKNIRFGEIDEGGDCFEPTNGREKIERNYDKKLSNLADLADDIEMDNTTYYKQKKSLEDSMDIDLRIYDQQHRDSGY